MHQQSNTEQDIHVRKIIYFRHARWALFCPQNLIYPHAFAYCHWWSSQPLAVLLFAAKCSLLCNMTPILPLWSLGLQLVFLGYKAGAISLRSNEYKADAMTILCILQQTIQLRLHDTIPNDFYQPAKYRPLLCPCTQTSGYHLLRSPVSRYSSEDGLGLENSGCTDTFFWETATKQIHKPGSFYYRGPASQTVPHMWRL